MIDLIIVLKRTNIKFLAYGSYVFIYIISLLGTAVLPEINFFNHHNTSSFPPLLTGIIIPCIMIAILTAVLVCFSSKSDIGQ